MANLSGFRYGVIVSFLFLLAACPKSTTPGTAGDGTGPGGRSQANQPNTRDQTRSGDLGTGKDSLEEARKGNNPVTPAESPLQEVYFGFDSFDLSNDARATLKRNADWLKGNQSVRVEIEGHCDDRGTNEYNLALGAKRAQAARDYLVSLGIPAERLSTISYGEELPVCREQSEDCWQKNRRDRFVVAAGRPPS